MVPLAFFVGDSLSVGVLAQSSAVQSGAGLNLLIQGSPVVGATLVAMRSQTHALSYLRPNVVHIMGGTNDAAGGADVATLLARMKTLVNDVRAASPSSLIVITPAPPSRLSWNGPLASFSARLSTVGASFVGPTPLSIDALSADGVHPSSYTHLATQVGQNIGFALHKTSQNSSGVLLTSLGLGLVATLIAFRNQQR